MAFVGLFQHGSTFRVIRGEDAGLRSGISPPPLAPFRCRAVTGLPSKALGCLARDRRGRARGGFFFFLVPREGDFKNVIIRYSVIIEIFPLRFEL